MNFMSGVEMKKDIRRKFPFIKDMVLKGLNYMVIVQIEKRPTTRQGKLPKIY